MENKDWADFFKDLTGDQQSGDAKSPGGDLTGNTIPHNPNSPEDEWLREILNTYSPEARIEGWEKIEASLDASDDSFDHQIRHRITQYHPAYDPHSWAKFAKRFSAHRHLRTRLIAIKLSEAAAIFLLMLSVLHLGYEENLKTLEGIRKESLAASDIYPTAPVESLNASIAEVQQNILKTGSYPQNKGRIKEKMQDESKLISSTASRDQLHIPSLPSFTPLFIQQDIHFASNEAISLIEPIAPQPIDTYIDQINFTEGHKDQSTQRNIPVLAFIEQPAVEVEYVNQSPIQKPTLVSTIAKKYLEFGILAQADYNQLKMPEDRLTSDGRQIIFPLQGITSPGFGAGFTLAIGHPRWAVETGVIYNSKTFKPGRALTIGNSAANSKVEFDAMHMQLISVPLQFRYRFDVKGRLKSYTFAGFGLNVIAQSDIDVKVDYNFPSLPEGEDPNNNPSLARTIRQTQRISNDFRKDAPFSNNSYVSANIGLGIEYALVENKTLFLQTAYQYQVPNLRFSNHNGKHVLSLSFQAGIRTPLGQ